MEKENIFNDEQVIQNAVQKAFGKWKENWSKKIQPNFVLTPITNNKSFGWFCPPMDFDTPVIFRYIYTLLRSEYVAQGCQNTKVHKDLLLWIGCFIIFFQPVLLKVRPCMPQQFVEQLYKCKPVQVFCSEFKKSFILNHYISAYKYKCSSWRIRKKISQSKMILPIRWSHSSRCGRSQILPRPSQELVRLSRCGRRSGNFDRWYQYLFILILIFVILSRPCQELLRLSKCGERSGNS